MHKRFVVTAKTETGKYWILWNRYKTYDGAVQAIGAGKKQGRDFKQWRILDRTDNSVSFF